jgi:anaerobic magnesium-protoporphyrin IX monomethyl ester cyclase
MQFILNFKCVFYMSTLDCIIISQSNLVNYQDYSRLPLDRLDIFSHLVYPRMIHYKNGFRSHLDIINKLSRGKFWDEEESNERRNSLNIWNLPGFCGAHLAGYLNESGMNTLAINNIDSDWEYFCEAYEASQRPPVVGISTTFHLNFTEIKRIACRLKEAYPDISIALGGAFVNVMFDGGELQALVNAMKEYGIDYAVHSFNSEVDFKNLLVERKKGKQNLGSLPNIIELNSSAKNGFVEGPRKWNDPVLGESPATWHTLNMPFLNKTIQLRTSSGCSFSCAFCSYPETARGVHLMEVDRVEEHIKSALKIPGIQNIIFIDDTFNVPIPRFKEMCRMFAKYNFNWFSFLRSQYIDGETAKLMKDSGCLGIYAGVESGNDIILKNMAKKATRVDFERGIGHLRKEGIMVLAAFVLGFPGETKETLSDNISFIEQTGIDFYSLKEFYYQENTPISRNSEEFGLTGMGKNWSHDTMDNSDISKHLVALFREIKGSVFIDPDTSLWYLAYMYDQGYEMHEIKKIQTLINEVVSSQLDGNFDDNHSAFNEIQNLVLKRDLVSGTL